MPNKVTMELVGLRDLDIALRSVLPNMEREKVILRALHDGARPITAEAKRRAPVLQNDGRLGVVRRKVVRGKAGRGKTKEIYGTRYREAGALRAGITQHTARQAYGTVKIRVRNRGYIFGAGKNGAAHAGNPNYWWLVHFGTSKMKGIPFLYDAFEAKKAESALAIRKSLLRGMLVVAQRLGFNVSGWAD